MIGLAGSFQGVVSLHCTLDQARSYTARMLGSAPEEVTDRDEICDALGEVVNMIAGSIKTTLSDRNNIALALPTVIIAEKPDNHAKGSVGFVVPFEDSAGLFHMELVVPASVND